MRVATFNIRTSRGRDGPDRWRLRRAACLAAIDGLGADVVGLQEVRRDQLTALRRAFPGRTVVGAARGRRGRGERASVLLPSGTWVLEALEAPGAPGAPGAATLHDTRWLSATPGVPGSVGWDAELPRVATLVRLRCGDTRLGILNTHFDHRGETARVRSAESIVAWLRAEPGRPWVVLGDLNAVPDSPALQVFHAAGWRQALPGDAGGTEHAFTGAPDRDRIDHVLVPDGVTVTAARVDHTRPSGRLPSDHWPVVADLVVDAASR